MRRTSEKLVELKETPGKGENRYVGQAVENNRREKQNLAGKGGAYDTIRKNKIR